MEPTSPPSPLVPEPAPAAPSPLVPTPPVKHSKLPILIGVFVILLVGSIVAYLSIQFFNLSPAQKQPNQTVLPSIPSAPEVSVEETKPTANWETYTSPNKYSVSYPEGWTVTASDETEWKQEAGVPKFTLINGSYSITFSFPTGFGPGSCIFSDQPDFANRSPDNLDMGESLCAGAFVEVKGDMYIFRRLSKPTPPPQEGGPNTWSIYTKERTGKFMTIPPISYDVPADYDPEMIQEMDRILSTLKLQQ